MFFLALFSAPVFADENKAPVQEQNLPAKLLLKQADSLYSKHKYREALGIYNKVLTAKKAYSPQMLLKMAAVAEPAEDYTTTLYCLSLYYLQNPGTQVKRRLEDLAERLKLYGYEGETDYFLYIYLQHYALILAAIISPAAALLVFMIRRRVLKMGLDYFPFFFPALVILGFTLANLNSLYSTGIVSGEKIYLMEAPASGSKPVEIIGPGHKVTISGQSDMWYRISWKGKDAYINANNLLVLEN